MSTLTGTLGNISPPKLAIMGAILAGMILFFMFVSLRVTTPSMTLLYADLSTVDSAAMAAKLEESGIKYEVSIDGTRILAAEDSVGKARLLLAEAGLPNGGSLGYEIFDTQSGFGTTNFVQNINQVRALEGELARTITSLGSVRSARVHLVLPQRELFSRESRPSSASVYLGLRPGTAIESGQIYAIQSLIASAVPDLKTSGVTVIDGDGNLLARGGAEEENGQFSVKADEMRRKFESRITGKIEDQVGRIVGHGNVRAIVTAEMNFDRISTNEELYDPSSQVVRSSQVTEEVSKEREPPTDDVGVNNNLPGLNVDLLDDAAPTAENNRLEEITNFEISKTVRNSVREIGEVQKLSVAVLVNGRYITQPVADGEDGETEKVYQERSDEELQQIEDLVRSAVGIDEDRGDSLSIKNMQFAVVDTNEEAFEEDTILGLPKKDLIDAAELILVGIMIVLVVLLVLQPMVTKILATEDAPQKEKKDPEMDLLAAAAAHPALAGPSPEEAPPEEEEDDLINMDGVAGQVKSSSIKKVEEIVDNYPTETISVIRSWMTQDG